MRISLWLLALMISISVKAEMVDTFQFHSDQERVRAVALAKSLRCPQCQNQNLVESNATQAYQLRLEVYEMVRQGKSNEEIIQIMTDRFGYFVNYKPPINAQTAILWGTPFALVLFAIGAIVWRIRSKK
ncbi:respiratory nitrite reductase-specific cytochrome c biogenesis protein NrfF [Nicoletella semolina]|uniref:Formate-dependent nitrite reductase complex subunit n=1 Tax=Nicoletella semolina TaxID=271160 RepID=A0A4R2N8U8_9PAST|nr:heme lyase NrfEFG subunit NrfF [Nicoletella semolina]MDH2924524.1 cytochrome C biosynthesis protein [Nicoletella semolina]TCP17348.1 respiratory nitrite reductase-specific cytochrome c biogenesis protein NrfF [Nicoletella semolina]